ncbi:hypothetical protein [Sphingobacterium sp. GVS05A]|uniref:hypothetical protein n=1 Tax=Sphingobacterium TaxID=28453 RepID=UPI000F9C2B7F|nr:hypothetical protein [Sphingobacterium sp. GVS05A]
MVLPAFAESPLTDLQQYGTYSLVGGKASFRIYQKEGKLYTTYLTDIFADAALKFSGNTAMILEDQTGKSVRFEFMLDRKRKVSLLNLNQLM